MREKLEQSRLHRLSANALPPSAAAPHSYAVFSHCKLNEAKLAHTGIQSFLLVCVQYEWFKYNDIFTTGINNRWPCV